MKIIELVHISKTYGKQKVLDDISYIFEAGFCYLITGSNGSGKSTLIKCILGINNFSLGSIIMNESQIAYVPEKIIFPEYLSIDNFLKSLVKINRESRVESIDNTLKEWEIYDDRNKYLKNLSKGMNQKVLIIQALLTGANIYIFDEPLNGLDRRMQKKFFATIRELKLQNKTIIISTHYKEKYRRLADKMLKIEAGKIY